MRAQLSSARRPIKSRNNLSSQGKNSANNCARIDSIGLAAALILRQHRGMSMNAVSPRRVLKALTAESRVLNRGVLGDKVDGRSREGRFLINIEREVTKQVGAPSFTQKMLIRRLARAMLRLELIDEKMAAGGEVSAHDGRTFSALSNQVRLLARELGVKAAPAEKAPGLVDYLASRAAAE